MGGGGEVGGALKRFGTNVDSRTFSLPQGRNSFDRGSSVADVDDLEVSDLRTALVLLEIRWASFFVFFSRFLWYLRHNTPTHPYFFPLLFLKGGGTDRRETGVRLDRCRDGYTAQTALVTALTVVMDYNIIYGSVSRALVARS